MRNPSPLVVSAVAALRRIAALPAFIPMDDAPAPDVAGDELAMASGCINMLTGAAVWLECADLPLLGSPTGDYSGVLVVALPGRGEHLELATVEAHARYVRACELAYRDSLP